MLAMHKTKTNSVSNTSNNKSWSAAGNCHLTRRFWHAFDRIHMTYKYLYNMISVSILMLRIL